MLGIKLGFASKQKGGFVFIHPRGDRFTDILKKVMVYTNPPLHAYTYKCGMITNPPI